MPYTGMRVALPIGQIGFTNIQNMSKTPIEGAIQAEGLEFIEGSVQREMGNEEYISFPADHWMLGILEYFVDINARRILGYGKSTTTNDTVIYKSTNRDPAVVVKSGLTFSGLGFQFITCGSEAPARPRKAMLFSGANPVQVVTGDAVVSTDISKPPVDWTGSNQPFFAILHNNCVWAGGNQNDPHRIYKSLDSDHEDFTTSAYSISVFPGEGGGLCGGYSFNGRLFLFKRPRGIYWINDESIEENDWGVRKLIDTLGLANPNALCETETDLLFLDPSPGLYSLGTVQEFGEVRPRSVLEEFGVDRWLKDNLRKLDKNWDLNTVPKIVWHGEKRTAILTFVKHFNVFGKLFLDYRFAPVKVGYSFRDQWLTSAVITNAENVSKHVYGSLNKLYVESRVSRAVASLNDGPWTSKYQTPHISFEDNPDMFGERIALEWLTIESTMQTEQAIMVDVFLDGVYKYTLNFTFPPQLTGFVLDTDQLDIGHLADNATYTRTRRLRGTCERFSFLFYSEHPTTNFVLNDVHLSFRRNSTRQRRKP